MNNTTNIPELSYFKSQKIQISIPNNKKCLPTLFFQNKDKEINIPKESQIKNITLFDKNYFITFCQCEGVYNPYLQLLKENGLIRSYYNYGKNNLFLCRIEKNPILKNITNDYNLDKFQKVFRYLNSQYLLQKDMLYKYYISKKKLFFEDFDFIPETYIYPEDKIKIKKKFENYKLNTSDLWLVKPSNLCGGKNIMILNSLNEINLENFIITRYITNISLINGKKYDLRLYVLITGLKPLRIYFYNEGFVRIATQIFSLNISSIKNKFIHLTNICINDKSKKYINPNYYNDKNANIWSISMYKNFLKSYNVEWYDIRQKIKDIIIKSILCIYSKLLEENDLKNVDDKSFYNLLGYDILIDDKFSPNLIEINKNPTMEINNILENEIKKKLFTDTLNLVGIIPYSRKTEKPLKLKNYLVYNKDDNINNALCELERPRGDYELIFPLKNNINVYKKYFFNISEENNCFWNKILS